MYFRFSCNSFSYLSALKICFIMNISMYAGSATLDSFDGWIHYHRVTPTGKLNFYQKEFGLATQSCQSGSGLWVRSGSGSGLDFKKLSGFNRTERRSKIENFIWGAVWKKTIRFVNHVFWAYLDHSLSDMYIGNILLIYRTKCTLSRTKILAQNKSDKIVFFQTAPHNFS